MRFTFGRYTADYELGIYAINWGYPVKHNWEVGIRLFKWHIGLELGNDLD